jgi:hypothetical protein
MTIEEMKAAILQAEDRKPELVKTPEWAAFGVPEVYVIDIGGDGRDRYDQIQGKKKYPTDDNGDVVEEKIDFRGLRAALVSMGLCDARGNHAEWTEREIHALGKKSGAALDRVFRRIRDKSGLGADAVEQAEKNSPADPNGNSG